MIEPEGSGLGGAVGAFDGEGGEDIPGLRRLNKGRAIGYYNFVCVLVVFCCCFFRTPVPV